MRYIFLITLSLGLLPTVLAQAITETRLDLRLRLRDTDGRPLVNIEVGLTRVWDNAPMGTRFTDAHGEAVWDVAPGYVFQFETPYHLHPITQAVLGDQGLTGLGVYTGYAGDINPETDVTQPIIVSLVAGDEAGQSNGTFVHFDTAPDDPQPQPAILPQAITPEDVLLPSIDPIPLTPTTADSNTSWLWLVAGLAIIAFLLWLRPVLWQEQAQ